MHFRDATKTITSICDIHPRLISLVLALVVKYLKYIDRYSLTMFKQMPLKLWKISQDKDLIFLEDMLMKPLDCTEHELSKLIIENLHWSGMIPNAVLPTSIQRDIMILISKSVAFHRKDSNYSFVRKDPWLQLEAWSWLILQKVTLHDDTEQSLITVKSVEHPSLNNFLSNVENSISKPPFDSISAYTLLSLSDVGHSLSKFNEIAGHWIEKMVSSKQIRRVIRIVSELSVRFAELVTSQSVEYVSSTNLTFHPHIDNILYMDTTSSFMGTTFGRLVNMERIVGEYTYMLTLSICRFIEKISQEGKSTKLKSFTTFWMNEITKITAWNSNACCLYFLDSICKTILRLKNVEQFSEMASYLSSKTELESFALYPTALFGSSTTVIDDAFFSKDIRPKTDYPFLSLFYLIGLSKSEFHKRQQVANMVYDSKLSMEAVGKKNDGVKYAIYRILAYCITFSDQIINVNTLPDTTQELVKHDIHSCLPLFWQLFFNLYFEKQVTPLNTVRFFGYQFFEIPNKQKIFTAIFEKLEQLKKYYNEVGNTPNPPGYSSTIGLVNIYHAMLMWLKSTKDSFTSFIDQISRIPDYFMPVKLVSAINEEVARDPTLLWLDILDISMIEKRHSSQASTYLPLLYPNLNTSALNRRSTMSLVFNSNKLDVLYLKNKEREIMKSFPSLMITGTPYYPPGYIMNPSELSLNNFEQCVSRYRMIKEKHEWVDRDYLYNAPNLYMPVKKQSVLYLRCYKGPLCKSPGKVTFNIAESEENKVIEGLLANNREMVQSIMETEYLDGWLYDLLLKIDITFENITNQKEGRTWFYSLLNIYKQIIDGFPPIRSIIEKTITDFSRQFISKNSHEMLDLLNEMTKDIERIQLLNMHFDPMICPEIWPVFLEILFSKKSLLNAKNIVSVYTRFDIDTWLDEQHSPHVRASLLVHALDALKAFNKEKSALSQEGENDIFMFYIHTICKTVGCSMESLFLSTLKNILASITELPILLLASLNKTLAFDQLTETLITQELDIVCEFLWNQRRQKNVSLLTCWRF